MARVLCIWLTWLALVPCAAVAAPLVVAVEDDAAPWSQRDGSGYANDVVRAAFEAAGVDIALTVVPYARCKDMVVKGHTVACFNMAWVPELAGKVVFADKPLFTARMAYFVNAAHPLAANRTSDLPRGTLLGVVNGYEYPPSVYALRDQGVVAFEESRSDEVNLQKLALGRLKIALIANIHDINPESLIMAKAQVLGKVKSAFGAGAQDSYIGFSVSHPLGPMALKAFNHGYQLISGNGTLAHIDDKWKRIAQVDMQRYTGR